MPLSKTRRRFLTAYRRYREQGGPTLRNLIGLRFVVFLALGAVLFAVGFSVASPFLMGFAIGLFAGLVEVDYFTAERVIRSWPMIADVVDWQKVDRLLEEDERSPP